MNWKTLKVKVLNTKWKKNQRKLLFRKYYKKIYMQLMIFDNVIIDANEFRDELEATL